MKQYEKWAYDYYEKLINDYESRAPGRDKILAKVRKNNPRQHWMAGFEFAMNLVFNPDENGILNWSNTEQLKEGINKEDVP